MATPQRKSIGPNRPGNRLHTSVYTEQPRDLRFELAFVLVRRQPRLAPEMEYAHGHDHGLLDGADAATQLRRANSFEKSRCHVRRKPDALPFAERPTLLVCVPIIFRPGGEALILWLSTCFHRLRG